MSDFWLIVGIVYFFIGLITLAVCAGKYNGQQLTVVGLFHGIILFCIWMFRYICRVGERGHHPVRQTPSWWATICSAAVEKFNGFTDGLKMIRGFGFWTLSGMVLCLLITGIGGGFGIWMVMSELVNHEKDPDRTINGNVLAMGIAIFFGSALFGTVTVSLLFIANAL